MTKTIVAMFDSRADAERAAEELTRTGLARADMQIRSEPWTGHETRDHTTSWWEWLFGESDDRTHYTEGVQRGGAILTVTAPAERADRVRDLLEAGGADVEGTTTRGAATAQGKDVEKIPIVEERMKVGKRPVARGGVRVYSRTIEKPIDEEVRLREERVHVDRHPVDRPVTATDRDALRDRRIEVTASSEEAVVQKEARVVEEVVVSKDVGERVEHVRDTVRRTDVKVENIGGESPRREELLRQHDDDFRRHWTSRPQSSSLPYEQSRMAYGYGCDLATDPECANREWSALEPDARRRWEARNPGTWDRFKDSVQYSWDRARRGRRAA